ncbi:hypothetical protein POM88_019871 [Heracleum sosnowskyi]|uniref:Uncharacterized protein n=1 Tax=Heracleum sosnowskyi TaxID=360622 RepID=A0AAD8IBR5_9APIA|nr:hypothetical protein POM88_019871 [Heracleum sosnowskyi]
MEGEKVMESLDSLWFFSNVMHAPKIQPIEVHSTKEDPKVESEEKVKIPSEPIEIVETKRDVCLVHDKESSEERKMRKGSKKRRKKVVQETGLFPTERKPTAALKGTVNGGDYEKELGFDFRFDLSEICMMIEGYERFNGKKCGKIMPPLSDGMAMRQHLKSWAYAVACNVR